MRLAVFQSFPRRCPVTEEHAQNYLQQVRGFSAFRTGLFTLPLAIMMILCSPLSGRMVGRYGTQPSLLAAGAGFVAATLLLTGLNQHTPTAWLLLVYALFGVGLAMVNPAISNNAVAGMPLSQAGVAAAVASTSRQVGAAIGVAVSGTVVAMSHARGTDFTTATHPIWWAISACGAEVLALGFVSNTAWARASTERVAPLRRITLILYRPGLKRNLYSIRRSGLHHTSKK
jgi:MFS family permease